MSFGSYQLINLFPTHSRLALEIHHTVLRLHSPPEGLCDPTPSCPTGSRSHFNFPTTSDCCNGTNHSPHPVTNTLFLHQFTCLTTWGGSDWMGIWVHWVGWRECLRWGRGFHCRCSLWQARVHERDGRIWKGREGWWMSVRKWMVR